MEGYPSLVKGTVLKTVRSFAARGFEPHTFLLIKKSLCQIPMNNGPKNNIINSNSSLRRLLQTKHSSENGPKNNVKKPKSFWTLGSIRKGANSK